MTYAEDVLLRRYVVERDPDAFRLLVEKHRNMVFSVCKRILRNAADAEDAAQNCFLELSRRAASLNAPIAGWLHRVAVRISLDMCKRNRWRLARETKAAQLSAQSREPRWDEMQEIVDEAVTALPRDLRVPIVLHYLEGMNQEEVAAELGVTGSAVSKRVARGIEEIRKRLARKGVLASGVALAALLAAHAVEAAPTTMTNSLGKMALAGLASGAKTLGVAKIAATVALCAVVTGGAAYVIASSMRPTPAPGRVTVDIPAVAPVAALPAVAPALQADATPPVDPARIIYTGVVVDAKAKPVEGAEVAFCLPPANSIERTRNRLHGKAVITGKDGGFAFDVSGAGDDIIVVARKDGLALDWDVRRFVSGPQHYTFRLGPPMTLAGTVADEQGNPVADAPVHAYLTADGQRRSPYPLTGPEGWLTTRTDAKGAFHFDNIPGEAKAGLRYGRPGLPPILPAEGNGYSVNARYLPGQTDIKLKLPAMGGVRGRVVDADTGQPATGFSIVIGPADDLWRAYNSRTIVTGANGEFAVDGLLCLEHRLFAYQPQDAPMPWAFKPVKFTVQPGVVSELPAVKASKGGLLEVLVRDVATRAPIPAAYVTIYEPIDEGYFIASLRTRENGVGTFRAPAANYHIQAGASDYRYAGDGAGPVKVTAGQTKRVEVDLTSLPHTSGVVRDDEGRPAEGALICLNWDRHRVHSTDKDGRFDFSWLDMYAPVYLSCRVPERNLVAVATIDATTTQRDLDLKPGLTLTGRVVDEKGGAIPAASLFVHVLRGRYDPVDLLAARADADGRFTVRCLLPPETGQRYAVTASSPGYIETSQKPVTLAVAPDRTATVPDVVLTWATASLAGVVLDTKGRPAPYLPVFVDTPAGSLEEGSSDEQGRFRFERVSNGSHLVQAGFHSQGGGCRRAMSGDQNVVVRLGDMNDMNVSARSSLTKPPQFLTGKPLPKLDGFTFTPPPPETEGKKVLLLFWDMKQRTARHALETIAAKTEDLQKNDVIVLAIHAPASDRAPIDDWMKGLPAVAGAKAPFPLSVLPAGQNAGDTLLKEWGVQSLPWIVITDEKHVVVAEGFEGIDLQAPSVGAK